MVAKLLKKIFGSRNERLIKQMYKDVERINALESQISVLSDDELKAKTDEFKKRLADGETLDDLLSEAFATVREASSRVLNMRHFDVQLLGGIVLNDGKIAEMKTGEGKTLVATLPTYLNALAGKGVFSTTKPSGHTLTNCHIIKQFLDRDFTIKEIKDNLWKISTGDTL